jgi:uncharacterized membrane protein YtjA (UPF0391 family)
MLIAWPFAPHSFQRTAQIPIQQSLTTHAKDMARFTRSLLQFNQKENHMLSYAITFLIIAIIAGVLGFIGIAGIAAEIAKVLFVVFLVLFIISLVAGRRPPV